MVEGLGLVLTVECVLVDLLDCGLPIFLRSNNITRLATRVLEAAIWPMWTRPTGGAALIGPF